ncbi:iron chelate uptake ABC transporter family permease subunit [Achromobacter xylosoxidans]
MDRWLVHTVRLPRVLTALGAGAALGLSGALFQSLTRNPLGSPDVIGLTAGASAGAVAVAMVWPGLMPVAWGAAAGALLATAGVWFGSGRRLRRAPAHGDRRHRGGRDRLRLRAVWPLQPAA